MQVVVIDARDGSETARLLSKTRRAEVLEMAFDLGYAAPLPVPDTGYLPVSVPLQRVHLGRNPFTARHPNGSRRPR